MRYLFGILCVCALGVMPLGGCSETEAMPECEVAADCEDDNECTEDSCTGGVCDNATVENGTTCSDGACMDAVCTALASVSGSVFVIDVDDAEPPAVGATVSVRGTSIGTTTDEFGQYAFEVPVGTVFLQSWQDDAWGWIERWPVSEDGIMNLELLIVADEVVTQVEQDLGIEVDETKGIVEPFFEGESGLGGETVTLSKQHEHAITPNADGDWVSSDVVLPDVFEPWIAFFGVDVTEELTVDPKGVDGVSICHLSGPRDTPPPPPDTVYPVEAKFFTNLRVECMPAP